ncbi:MAG TPA: hypothetical protein VER03_25295 [Bryobacteraceae bacterium]|nr:hypothetical protein [Bryobacteraceae bacterium]
MKPILLVLLCSLPSLAQDVVFRGTPTVRVFATTAQDERQKLDTETAQKNECLIVQRGKKYFWASRNNAPLTRVDAAQFTYFIHNGGAGYVKVFTGNRETAKAPADYIENINQGFEVVTYWGRAQTVVTEAAK